MNSVRQQDPDVWERNIIVKKLLNDATNRELFIFILTEGILYLNS